MARQEAVAKRKSKGGRQISASLTADEVKLLARVRAERGFPTNKAAIIAGLKVLYEKEVDWPSELERLARDLRKMQGKAK